MVMTAATRALRLRPAVDSVALYGCCKRFFSALSAEDRKKMEDDLEKRVGTTMKMHFHRRVRGILDSEFKGLISSEAASINSERCNRNDNHATLTSKLVKEKQDMLINNLAAREVQARISFMKGMVYVVSVPSAIYGAWYRFTGKGGK